MKCRKTHRLLLIHPIPELEQLADKALVHHLNACPRCEAERALFIKFGHDLREGARFAPSPNFWQGWKLDSSAAKKAARRGQWRQLLQRLDWALMPERSFRYVAFAIVAAFMVVISTQIPFSADRGSNRLPNRLVVNEGSVMVKESLSRGFELLVRN